MSVHDAQNAAPLEQYRQYLATLARMQVSPRDGRHLDISDVVQQTFLEAHEKVGQLRGHTPAQVAGWLRQILAHNLADAFRGMGRAKRDAARQRSLESELEQSSLRLGGWLAAEQSSPSQHAQRHERALRLAQGLAELPDSQREALILQYWHRWSVADIAAHMGRTPVAVAGLLKRGLKQLRELLPDSE